MCRHLQGVGQATGADAAASTCASSSRLVMSITSVTDRSSAALTQRTWQANRQARATSRLCRAAGRWQRTRLACRTTITRRRNRRNGHGPRRRRWLRRRRRRLRTSVGHSPRGGKRSRTRRAALIITTGALGEAKWDRPSRMSFHSPGSSAVAPARLDSRRLRDTRVLAFTTPCTT